MRERISRRQRLHVERLRLVAELVGDGHERPAVERDVVQVRVGRQLQRHPHRQPAASRGETAFGEEWTETLARPLDRAQLRIEPIGESSRRGAERKRRQFGLQQPGDCVGGYGRRLGVLDEVAGCDRLVRKQERQHLSDRRALRRRLRLVLRVRCRGPRKETDDGDSQKRPPVKSCGHGQFFLTDVAVIELSVSTVPSTVTSSPSSIVLHDPALKSVELVVRTVRAFTTNVSVGHWP